MSAVKSRGTQQRISLRAEHVAVVNSEGELRV